MRDKQARLARIRTAKAELEAEARATEAARPRPPSPPDGSPKPQPGRTPKHEPGKPKPKTQRNFTDPQSRIMKSRDGFIQAYNAQAAVDAGAQIIVAHRLTNNGSGQDALLALLDAVEANTGEMPNEVSADNGFCSEANLEGLNARGSRLRGGRARKQARQLQKRRQAGSSYARQAPKRRASKPIPYPKIHRRTRVWTHQAGQRLPAIPPPRYR